MTSPTGETTAARRRPGRRGFTLIELILVLLLLGLATSLATPMLGRFSRGRTAMDAAGHLLAIMQYAQDQACVSGSPHRLHWDQDAGSYWLEASRQGRYERIASEVGRTFTLPENMTMKISATTEQLANGYIQFDADGGHDVLVIHLTDERGKEVVVGCSSPGEP